MKNLKSAWKFVAMVVLSALLANACGDGTKPAAGPEGNDSTAQVPNSNLSGSTRDDPERCTAENSDQRKMRVERYLTANLPESNDSSGLYVNVRKVETYRLAIAFYGAMRGIVDDRPGQGKKPKFIKLAKVLDERILKDNCVSRIEFEQPDDSSAPAAGNSSDRSEKFVWYMCESPDVVCTTGECGTPPCLLPGRPKGNSNTSNQTQVP